MYVQKETGYDINGRGRMWAGDSFWALSRRLGRHRTGNRLERSDYESCQRDILISTRLAMGLPDCSAEIQKSNVQQFVERKKGCASCGKKKKLSVGKL